MTRKEMEFIIEKIKFHKYYLKEYCQLTDREIREDKYAEALSCSKISLCFLRKINRDLQTARTVENAHSYKLL